MLSSVGSLWKKSRSQRRSRLISYCLRGLASVVLKAKEAAISTCEADIFTCEALFATMTNVNFDQGVLLIIFSVV